MLLRFACSLTLFFLWATSRPHSLAVTLNVNLEELRGPELLPFMRAVVPEVYGGEARHPLELSTLSELHAHLVQNSHHGTREFQTEARSNLRTIEALMRRALAKLDLPALRRMTLGDGKRNVGNHHLYPALYLRLIETEVAKICSEPKRSLAFPAEPPVLPEHFPIYPASGTDDQALRRALGPLADMLAKAKSEKPRGIHEESETFGNLSDAFLRGRDDKVAGKLLRFTWDSWCGTGS